MRKVHDGSWDSCMKFIQEEEDETIDFKVEASNISDTLYYVYELDGWDTYEGSF